MHLLNHISGSKVLLAYVFICFSSNLLIAQKANEDPEFWNQKLKGLMMDSDRVFLENQGQWEDEILFRASSEHSAILFYNTGITYSLRHESKHNISPDLASEHTNLSKLPHQQTRFDHLAWHWDFIGASQSCNVVASDVSQSNIVRFQNGKTKPVRDKHYAKLQYEELYPGINLDFYTDNDHNFKYDFVVKAGSDPDLIQIAVRDVDGLGINDMGELVMNTAWGVFKEKAPFSYQINPKTGEKIEITSAYKLLDEGGFGFELGTYNKEWDLIIDPIQLDWSTYFYGEGKSVTNTTWVYTWVYDIDIDENDHVYLTGVTNDRFLSRNNAYDTVFNGGFYDVYVCKMSPNGDSILNFTYIGGNGWEYAFNITVNARQEPVFSGFTYNSNYPVTPGAFDTVPNGIWYKGFITKLNASFDSLIFSTYFGGSQFNIIYELELNANGDVFVVGGTTSSDFPITSDAWQSQFGGGGSSWWNGGDGFFSKLSADGKELLYGTYIGGEDIDRIFGMHFNDSGEVYLCGYTKSKDFVTTAGSQFFFRSAARIQGEDGVLMKFKSDLKTLVYSNIMGGAGDERFESIFVNEDGEAYIGGYSNSTNFPTSFKAVQKTNAGGYDFVIVKVRREGVNILYSTYLGGSGNEYYSSGWWFNSNIKLAANTKDEAIICGYTQSSDYPVTADAMYATNTGVGWQAGTATITKLSMFGDKIVYGTYFGGSGAEFPSAVRVKRTSCVSNILLGGFTSSSDFPVSSNAYKDKSSGNQGWWNGFASKFRDTLRTEKIDLGPDLLKCDVIGVVLDAGNQGSDMRWSNGFNRRVMPVEEPGTYWVEATYGCDTVRDTVTIVLEYSPTVPILGDDSLFCDYFPGILLDAKNDSINARYLWQNMDSSQTLFAADTGKYMVRISTPNCGEKWDSVFFSLRNTPLLSAMRDSVFCDSINWIPSVVFNEPEGRWFWNGIDTLSSIHIKDTGYYQLFIQNQCGTDSAEFFVDLRRTPNATLPDDSVFCESVALWLKTGTKNNDESYLWSDIDLQQNFFQRNDSLEVTKPGTFAVQIENQCGISSDTIVIDLLFSPILDLGRDSLFCGDVQMRLQVGRNNNQETYVWQDASVLDYYDARDSGTYYVAVSNKCGSAADTLRISKRSLPQLILPDDSVFCNVVNWQIDATQPDPELTYLWNTGSTAPLLNVSDKGLYHLVITNICGSAKDSVRLGLLYSPVFTFSKKDYVFCDVITPFELQVTKKPDNEETLLWSDGSGNPDIMISDEGWHSLQISNKCGTAVDSILVSISQSPVLDLGPDTVLCGNFSVLLDAGNPGMSYLWEPGGSTTQFFDARTQGTFKVTVSNDDGCTGSDEFVIGSNCVSHIYVPDAFSPNADGINDVFKPSLINYEQYELQIYDRWGALLFKTNSADEGWDGTYRNQLLPAGAYFFTMRFVRTEDMSFQNINGVLHLLK